MPGKHPSPAKRKAALKSKKPPTAGTAPSNGTGNKHTKANHYNHTITAAAKPTNGLIPPLTSTPELERCISKILLLRYRMDICRLFSAHLHNVCDRILPSILLDSVILASPAWMALNATDLDLKQFFRTAIAMDLRQAGDRVATKSVLWSYTALRHFAISHNVHICEKGGLHSITLLPYISQLQAHLATLESLPTPTFSNPPTMGPATSGWSLIEKHCKMRLRKMKPESIPPWWDQWSEKIKLGYERLVTTLWNIANEYHVDGYGLVLREKLEKKWCDCGCSTDHLGEVCERTVREEEEESKRRAGKEREWDGRGNGVEGWGTPKEEDIWEVNLEFGGWEERQEPYKNVSELVQWRYFKAEKEKEKGNKAFKLGNYVEAIEKYTDAYKIEPEMPHYQLNIAAAHIKLSNWIEAEKACTLSLGQHKSGKGYYRRAQARKAMNRIPDAIADLEAALELDPENVEARVDLDKLRPPEEPIYGASSSSNAQAGSSSHVDEWGETSGSGSSGRNGGWYPFALHEADSKKLKFTSGRQMFENPETKRREYLSYPIWDRYEVQAVPAPAPTST